MNNPQEKNPSQEPALVINIRSWVTPIAALVMLVIGLLGGYLGRPLLASLANTPTPVVKATPVSAAPSGNESAPSAEEMMQNLVAQTRHFRGEANAPVTIIEFGDFQ